MTAVATIVLLVVDPAVLPAAGAGRLSRWSVGPVVGFLAAIALGYVLGAIPFGVVIARLAGGTDPRTVGSQRTGATNTVRALGPGWGLVVGLLDVAKGLVAAAAGAAIGSAVGLVPEWVAAGSLRGRGHRSHPVGVHRLPRRSGSGHRGRWLPRPRPAGAADRHPDHRGGGGA